MATAAWTASARARARRRVTLRCARAHRRLHADTTTTRPRHDHAPATRPRRVRAGPAARLLARARRGASPARRALRRLASLPCRRCRRHGGRCGAASAAARADQRQPRAAPLLDAKGHACLNSFMRPRVHVASADVGEGGSHFRTQARAAALYVAQARRGLSGAAGQVCGGARPATRGQRRLAGRQRDGGRADAERHGSAQLQRLRLFL